jgi:predicted DNA-binding transcriptional regulator AlpA
MSLNTKPNTKSAQRQTAEQGCQSSVINRRTSDRTMLRVGRASEYVGLAKSTLAKMRMCGEGPPFIKAGPRIVLYDRADLDAWLESRKRTSTMENA